GASGAQITEELCRAGRHVYLSVGAHTRLPRRYRGRDLIWWLGEMGIDQTPVEARGPSRLLPLITGAYGGHTIDFRRFAADGLTLLEEPAARAGLPDPACVTEPLRRLDIGADGIGAVIWATGYALDFGWIDIPVLDARGEPLHRHGIAEVPGLYFLGLQWLSKMKSSFLSGVGDVAAVLAD